MSKFHPLRVASLVRETRDAVVVTFDVPPEHREAYSVTSARMTELAQAMPGYVDAKTFTADDGERVLGFARRGDVLGYGALGLGRHTSAAVASADGLPGVG